MFDLSSSQPGRFIIFCHIHSQFSATGNDVIHEVRNHITNDKLRIIKWEELVSAAFDSINKGIIMWNKYTLNYLNFKSENRLPFRQNIIGFVLATAPVWDAPSSLLLRRKTTCNWSSTVYSDEVVTYFFFKPLRIKLLRFSRPSCWNSVSQHFEMNLISGHFRNLQLK